MFDYPGWLQLTILLMWALITGIEWGLAVMYHGKVVGRLSGKRVLFPIVAMAGVYEILGVWSSDGPAKYGIALLWLMDFVGHIAAPQHTINGFRTTLYLIFMAGLLYYAGAFAVIL